MTRSACLPLSRPLRLPFALTLLSALVAWMPPTSLDAASVEEVDLHGMADDSSLVFEGRAMSRETRTGSRGRIRTCFTFLVTDVLEGTHRGGPLELCFAGGRAGDLELRIGGMIHPQLGERGIYFVERNAGGLVHPLCGWDQGHFVFGAESVGKGQRVFTARGRPVAGLAEPRTDRRPRMSRGVAEGVVIGTRALRASEFKARFRALRRARRSR